MLFKDPDMWITFTNRTAMNKCPFYATKMHTSIQKWWKTLILNFAFTHIVCTFWFLHTLHQSPSIQRPSVICYCVHIPPSLVPTTHLLYPSEMFQKYNDFRKIVEMWLQKMKVISLALSKRCQKFTHKQLECQLHVWWDLIKDVAKEIIQRQLANMTINLNFRLNL